MGVDLRIVSKSSLGRGRLRQDLLGVSQQVGPRAGIFWLRVQSCKDPRRDCMWSVLEQQGPMGTVEHPELRRTSPWRSHEPL